ncbi:MAG TPA: OsmC family protein [Caldimonas sp.]
MTQASASIGSTRYAVSITTGNHRLSADEPADQGRQDAGPTPMQLLCSALGACTAITLTMYAARKGWPLRALRVDICFAQEGEQRAIDRRLAIEGDLQDDQRVCLADVAERTPVTLTLKQGVPITTTLA